MDPDRGWPEHLSIWIRGNNNAFLNGKPFSQEEKEEQEGGSSGGNASGTAQIVRGGDAATQPGATQSRTSPPGRAEPNSSVGVDSRIRARGFQGRDPRQTAAGGGRSRAGGSRSNGSRGGGPATNNDGEQSSIIPSISERVFREVAEFIRDFSQRQNQDYLIIEPRHPRQNPPTSVSGAIPVSSPKDYQDAAHETNEHEGAEVMGTDREVDDGTDFNHLENSGRERGRRGHIEHPEENGNPQIEDPPAEPVRVSGRRRARGRRTIREDSESEDDGNRGPFNSDDRGVERSNDGDEDHADEDDFGDDGPVDAVRDTAGQGSGTVGDPVGSDGDPSLRPAPSTGYSRCSQAAINNYEATLREVWGKEGGRNVCRVDLMRIPAGYELFEKRRREGTRQMDRKLYGHPKGTAFNSPKQFYKHLINLIRKRQGNRIHCTCECCDRHAHAREQARLREESES